MAKKQDHSVLRVAGGIVLGAILYHMGADIYKWAKRKWQTRHVSEEQELTIQ